VSNECSMPVTRQPCLFGKLYHWQREWLYSTKFLLINTVRLRVMPMLSNSVWTHCAHGWQCRCQEDSVSLSFGELEKTTSTSPHHMAQHRPTGFETPPPYTPWSSRTALCGWCWHMAAILDLHARNDDNDCEFEAECDPEEVDCSSEAERDQKRKSYRSFMPNIHLNSRLYATQALLIHMTNVRYALQLRFQFCLWRNRRRWQMFIQRSMLLSCLCVKFFSYACHEHHHNWSAKKQRLHPQCSRDKPPFSFVRGQFLTMWDIVWVSPQGHRSVSDL